MNLDNSRDAGIESLFAGVLIKGVSIPVHAAESYLYDLDDHPMGSREEIADADGKREKAQSW